jgi:hypothetical protein
MQIDTVVQRADGATDGHMRVRAETFLHYALCKIRAPSTPMTPLHVLGTA